MRLAASFPSSMTYGGEIMAINRTPLTLIAASAVMTVALACTPRDRARDNTDATTGTAGTSANDAAETPPPPAARAPEPTRPGAPGTTGGAVDPEAPDSVESLTDENRGLNDAVTPTD